MASVSASWGFFAKAACMALKDLPSVNASIDGDEIVYHDYADISVAVSGPGGLGRSGDPRCRPDVGCADRKDDR